MTPASTPSLRNPSALHLSRRPPSAALSPSLSYWNATSPAATTSIPRIVKERTAALPLLSAVVVHSCSPPDLSAVSSIRHVERHRSSSSRPPALLRLVSHPSYLSLDVRLLCSAYSSLNETRSCHRLISYRLVSVEHPAGPNGTFYVTTTIS